MKSGLFVSGVMLLVMAAASCMKGADTTGCTLRSGPHTATADGNVTYFVKHSDRASLQSVIYEGIHGPVQVDAPSLPFTVTIPVTKGNTLHISAEGIAMEGNIMAGYTLITSQDTTTVQDICEDR